MNVHWLVVAGIIISILPIVANPLASIAIALVTYSVYRLSEEGRLANWLSVLVTGYFIAALAMISAPAWITPSLAASFVYAGGAWILVNVVIILASVLTLGRRAQLSAASMYGAYTPSAQPAKSDALKTVFLGIGILGVLVAFLFGMMIIVGGAQNNIQAAFGMVALLLITLPDIIGMIAIKNDKKWGYALTVFATIAIIALLLVVLNM